VVSPIVPRVTIKAGSFKRKIMTPFPNPTRSAANTPRPKEMPIGQPPPNRLAVKTETNEVQAPMDRSIPFASMTRDMPKVNKAKGLPARRIFVKFSTLKNSGTTAAKSAKTTRKRIAPLGTCPRIAANLRSGIEDMIPGNNFTEFRGVLSGIPGEAVGFGFQAKHFFHYIF
jgi:hypothetical protein